jgi:FkbM family methyltransferase
MRVTQWELLKDVIPNDHARQVTSRYYIDLVMGRSDQPRVVMDLGCGRGTSAAAFRQHRPDVVWVGVDLRTSPEVDSRGGTDLLLVLYDGTNLPFGDATVDCVYSHQVFEHVRHPEPLLREIARVLRPRGLFIGSTSQLEPYHSLSLWNYTVYGFATLARDAGLEVVEVRPSVDGVMLTKRSCDGRHARYNVHFVDGAESPLNAEIDAWGRETGRRPALINNRKLLVSGHFAFMMRRPAPPRPPARAEPPTEVAAPAPSRPVAKVGRRLQRVASQARTVGARNAVRAARRRLRPAIRSRRGAIRNFRLTLPAPPGGRRGSAPGLRISVPRDLYVPRLLERGGLAAYELDTLACLLALVDRKRHATFFDVGANVGVFALVAAALSQWDVIAFEPEPRLAGVAQALADRNRLGIVVERLALAERSGTATLHLSDSTDTSHSLARGFRPSTGGVTVPCETLDSYCRRTGRLPDVVKIDTETTEPEVLAGGRRLLRTHRPWLICEVLAGRSESRLTAVLSDLDYRWYPITSVSPLERRSAIAGDPTHAHTNWLFAPEEPSAALWDRMDAWRRALGTKRRLRLRG